MPDGFLDGWKHRRPLTFLGTQIPGSVSAFPLDILYDAGAYPFSQILPDGADLRFTLPDGTTEVDFGIEVFSEVGLNAWKAEHDLVSGSDYVIGYVQYGNAAAASEEDMGAVFNARTVARYGLADTGGPLTDDTGIGEPLTVTGSPVFGEAGQPGLAVKWPSGGAASYASGNALAGLNGVSAFTLEWWHERSASATGEYALVQIDSSVERILVYYHAGSSTIDVHFRNGANTYKRFESAAGAPGSFHHHALVFDGSISPSSDRLQLYVDGDLKSGPVYGGALPETAPDCDGGVFKLNSDWPLAQDVWIDELRASDSARSTHELDASRLSAGGLVEIGEEQTAATWVTPTRPCFHATSSPMAFAGAGALHRFRSTSEPLRVEWD